MKNSILFLFIGAVYLCTGFPVQAQEGVKVIVHNDVSITQIEQDKIQRIFLGKAKFWDDGSAIIPVILKDGPVHEIFLQELVKRNKNKFRAFWNRICFTGVGIPPKSFAEETELIKYVAETPGAIGYVSSDTVTPDVKTVSVQ